MHRNCFALTQWRSEFEQLQINRAALQSDPSCPHVISRSGIDPVSALARPTDSMHRCLWTSPWFHSSTEASAVLRVAVSLQECR